MVNSSQTITADRRARQNEYDSQQNGDGSAPEVDGPGETGEAAAQGFGQIVSGHGILLHVVIGVCRLIRFDLTHVLLMPLMRMGIDGIWGLLVVRIDLAGQPMGSRDYSTRFPTSRSGQ
jgi:hypothetical protein